LINPSPRVSPSAIGPNIASVFGPPLPAAGQFLLSPPQPWVPAAPAPRALVPPRSLSNLSTAYGAAVLAKALTRTRAPLTPVLHALPHRAAPAKATSSRVVDVYSSAPFNIALATASVKKLQAGGLLTSPEATSLLPGQVATSPALETGTGRQCCFVQTCIYIFNEELTVDVNQHCF
jgi:hypothetical protein